MALFRTVSTSFWTDCKVTDDFTWEEKYLFLYLMTNPHTNIAGCYEISMKQMAYETGCSVQKIKILIESLSDTHNVIRYNDDTKEVLLLNWYKHNWTNSDKCHKALEKNFSEIKCDRFREYLGHLFNGECSSDTLYESLDRVSEKTDRVSEKMDRVSSGEKQGEYPTQNTITITNTNSNTNSNANTDKETITEIIDYLNEMTGQHYKADTRATVDLIRARLRENFTIDDFRTVIYKKTQEWKDDPKMVGYLRPQTLFSNKFESYLNQVQVRSPNDKFQDAVSGFMGGEQ